MDNSRKLEALGITLSQLKSAIPCSKLHRHSLNKQVQSCLFLLPGCLQLLEFSDQKWIVKQKIELNLISRVSISALSDGIFVLHNSGQKGDLVLKSDEFCVEFLAALCNAMKEIKKYLDVQVTSRIELTLAAKKEVMEFASTEEGKFSMKQKGSSWIANVPKSQGN